MTLSAKQSKIYRTLNTPAKIQDYLNTLKFNFEINGETCASPLGVLQSKKAHCMEGAMLAASILRFHGSRPLVLDLRAKRPDDDHVLALFRRGKYWGALSKTNHAVLRYREPVYRSLRELAMSYFHEYFDQKGNKNLREYSLPVNLTRFDALAWETTAKDLWQVPRYLDSVKHFPLITKTQAKGLRKAEGIEIKAGEIVEWPSSRD